MRTSAGYARRLSGARGPPAYADYVKVAAEEIQEHTPGTLVVAPVSRSEPGSKTVELFRSLKEHDVGGGRNAASYMDAISWHLVAGGWNPEGYQQFSMLCESNRCTLTSGYPSASWRRFDWDFGDESTATGQTVTQTYSAPGTYFMYHGA